MTERPRPQQHSVVGRRGTEQTPTLTPGSNSNIGRVQQKTPLVWPRSVASSPVSMTSSRCCCCCFGLSWSNTVPKVATVGSLSLPLLSHQEDHTETISQRWGKRKEDCQSISGNNGFRKFRNVLTAPGKIFCKEFNLSKLKTWSQ